MMSMPQDKLSPLTWELLKLNQSQAYSALVVRGQGDEPAREKLRSARPEQLLTTPMRSPEMGQAMLSGLWLWHDWLDESHRISQNLASETGSFWHAIMHRREGDFSNSKYWYARCRNHPALGRIGAAVEADPQQGPEAAKLGLIRAGQWQPNALVDLAEQVHDRPDDPRHALAVALQRIEWRGLFEFCAQAAG